MGPSCTSASAGPIRSPMARAMVATARREPTRSRPASTNGMKPSIPAVTTASASLPLLRTSASSSATLVRLQMTAARVTSGSSASQGGRGLASPRTASLGTTRNR